MVCVIIGGLYCGNAELCNDDFDTASHVQIRNTGIITYFRDGFACEESFSCSGQES